MSNNEPGYQRLPLWTQNHLDVSLSQLTISLIEQFLNMRNTWGKTHNLSGPKALGDPWLIDVNDGIALSTILTSKTLPLIDVGSGSGIPGLIVKLVRPEQEMVLIEPLPKRVAFLKTVIHKLGLHGISVQREKWPLKSLGACEVVSRAVVHPKDWPRLANSGEHVKSIYRFLARNRPVFSEQAFELGAAQDYQRSDEESLRVERWDRVSLSE